MHMIIETDLTMEQAMSMLLTGGAVCPEVIRYSAPIPAPVTPDTSRAAEDLVAFSSMSRAGFTWAPDQRQ
jgi:uncharacterized membrane protein